MAAALLVECNKRTPWDRRSSAYAAISGAGADRREVFESREVEAFAYLDGIGTGMMEATADTVEVVPFRAVPLQARAWPTAVPPSTPRKTAAPCLRKDTYLRWKELSIS